MRKFVEFSKAEIGLAAEVCESFADYAPGVGVIDGRQVALKANGSPADICGGWCARRKAALKEMEAAG